MHKTLSKSLLIIALTVVFSACGGNKQKKDPPPATDTIPTELSQLNEQIKEQPENAELFRQRAKYYLENRQVNLALSDINTAIQLDEKNPALYVTLSDIYFVMGSVQKSKDALQKAINLNPSYVEALLKMAELNFYLKQYPLTFEYINKTLDVDAINPQAYFLRAMTYKDIGDTAKAIKDFQTTIEQDTAHFHAYIQLGLIYSIRRNKLAEGYLQNAIKSNPNNIEGYYALGMYYQENDELNKALETYTQLLKIDPKYKYAYYNMGYIHLVYLKVYSEAARYFTKAINSDPFYVEAYYNRGYCLELMGDIMNAQQDYKKALEIRPNYIKAIEGLNRVDELLKREY